MSSAEPFMPAHEPPRPAPPQEHDIDHDADVIFDSGDAETADADAAPWQTDTAEPSLRRPVPGEHLTAEQLAEDIGATDAE